jgi:hypothetical protein
MDELDAVAVALGKALSNEELAVKAAVSIYDDEVVGLLGSLSHDLGRLADAVEALVLVMDPDRRLG